VETLLRYELAERPVMEAVVESEPIVLFGIHACDIYGLRALDIAFSDQNVDPNYAARRSQMRIVGVDCKPDDYCFCGSMGSATPTEGFDLFLTPVAGGYLAETATEAGAAMLTGLPTREATSEELAEAKARLARRTQETSKLSAEVHSLPLILSGLSGSANWEKHAERCYSCGTCNLVCPTCYCFNVTDKMALSLDQGNKDREWDGCMLEEFGKVATGENFREEREQRLRHRFYRKYSYLFTKFGRPYCCGCGRCVRQCLVHIDPVAVLNDMAAEAEGRKG